MRAVLPDSARRFGRAIVMPNLKPPVVTTAEGAGLPRAYCCSTPARHALRAADDALPYRQYSSFRNCPRPERSGVVHGVKYYPAGATTNSAAGVTDIARCYGTLEAMEEIGMPLLVHGEVTDPEVDVFDKEKVFMNRVLIPVTRRFPD